MRDLWRHSVAMLRNPRLVADGVVAVVHRTGLEYALRRNPRGMFQQLTRDLAAA